MDLSWLKTIAPTVATALGGPLAGIAAKIVADKLGIPEATQDSVVDALTSGKLDSEQLAQLKLAEVELQRQENELGFKFAELNLEFAKVDASDRASARMRESDTKDSTPRILAYCIVAVWAALNLVLFTVALPDGSEQLVARVLGTLDAALMICLYYYFGSSSGSAKKDLLLARKER